ncbi:efflux RND transporter periplasmic adaptor subunit [Teredinibacter franksiae]|uniref:efflux RND transporter periplasmic adaptor subunit n=1 Tax=Teredinibacter franksiae TaxID=2761453 RepID=UPI001629DBC8|nr:efflux RND transporter periplasmic adaptor subunit [Teredinibacter franksiae]
MKKLHTAVLLALVLQTPSAMPNEPVAFNCRIEPHVRVDVSSSAEGVVSEVLVSKNDSVSEGDVLARLEASLESATVDLRRLQTELTSDVDAQKLTHKFAQRNLKRVQDLYDKKAASYAELDKVKTEYELAAQQLQQAKDRKRQAEMEYKRALADLSQKTITSPIEGVVVERYKEPGEHIYFEPILQIAQLNPLKVEVFVPAHFYGKIKLGMNAVVTPELNIARSFYNAKVDQVDKVIDAPSNTFGVSLSIPNPLLDLPSGLKCKVSFPDVRNQSALLGS